MRIKIVFFIIIISNTQIFSWSGSGGPGTTSGNAYEIWTKNDLLELNDSLCRDFIYYETCWHCDKHFRLMQDIDFNNITPGFQVPQGLQAPFNGHFHGAGKKITVAIVYDYTGSGYMSSAGALFNTFYRTIDSLTVDGYINGFAGIASGLMAVYGWPIGSISYCINNATITEWGSGGITYSNSGTIINCINNGDITGVDCVAGIAAMHFATGTITNCINTGNITATNSGSELTGGGDYIWGVGGIAASTGGNILNCINLGTVEGQRNVGGIVGMASGSPLFPPLSIINCINYGYVKGIDVVGGIVGISYNNIPIISNCVNAGVVEGESDVGSITGKE